MAEDSSGFQQFAQGFATKAIRCGQDPCAATGATIVPIYQTATFTLDAVGRHKGFDYSRTINPTRVALERQLAELEGARFGVAFGSGMAAASAVASLLRQGDHIVATRDIYGGTYRLLVDLLPRWGIETTFVDMTDVEATRAAIRPRTKLLWIETPTNPTLRIIDIAAIASIKGPDQLVVVDNTFCSPFFQQPLALGADVVFHSTTKYINGHSDVVGGIVVTDDPEVRAGILFWQNAVGAIPGPQDAYLTIRGAKTLSLRMREHERNARAVAEWLTKREDVVEVFYPGLPDHPEYELAKQQMTGFGGIVSLRVRGGEARALDIAKRTQVFQLATSLGGVESLICSPQTMTHGSMPREVRIALGVTPDLLRLSVGIENIEDILRDLQTAFDAVPVRDQQTV
jgi:cystathionine gamma-synthase/cystathionine gamma-lyase